MPTTQRGAHVVIGRTEELATLRSFAVDPGRWPAAIVVEGEPGIGKSTLWRAAAAEAESAGHRVLRASPDEPDRSSPYGVLTDLLEPLVADLAGRLPDPQRHALAVAMLEEEAGSAIDPRAVSAGVRSLLRAAASDGPVLLAIDDLQWIDAASDRALAHACRRLGDVPVGALLARRHPEEGRSRTTSAFGEGTSQLPLGPLGPDAIAAIIRELDGPPIPRRLLRDIHRESGGNPFYAVELARAARAGEDRPTGLALPVPRTLRDDLVRGRVSALSSAAAETALVAAAASRPTVELVRDVVPDLATDVALADAVRSGLLRIEGGEIRFTHPLYRSAIYADASRDHRHRVHRAIADVVDDPEERGRHLAFSTDLPDTSVAALIEAGAAAARARGAPDAAAELLTHAIRLTPTDTPELARRRLAAGEDRFLAGDVEGGLAEAGRAAEEAPSASDRSRALARLGAMERASFRAAAARIHLLAALDAEGLDDDDRCVVHADLCWASLQLGDARGASEEADRAVEIAGGLDTMVPRARAWAAAARTSLLRHGGVRSHPFATAPDVWEPISGMPMREWPLLELAGELVIVDEVDRARLLIASLLRTAADRGDDIARSTLLDHLARLEIGEGRWDAAIDAARSSCELDDDPDTARARGRLAWLGAARGDEASARADASRSLARASALTDPSASTWARAALGMLELSAGRHAQALGNLEPLAAELPRHGSGDPGVVWFLGDLIEAQVAAGDLEHAGRAAVWLSERAGALGRPRALLEASRAQALLDAAAGELDSADASLGRTLTATTPPLPYERARASLTLGHVRRRVGHKRLAREALLAARGLFADLGAPSWIERVDDELGHITGRRPARGLTDIERRVAMLAAGGSRNREIADQLVMSVRTVEGHLSDVYGKLNVRSRTELAPALDGSDDEDDEDPA